MEDGEIEREQAELWAAYWSLRALKNPTPPLDQARRHLWHRLNQPPPEPHRPSRRRQRGHLHLIGHNMEES